MYCDCGRRLTFISGNLSFELKGVKILVIGMKDALGCYSCQTIIEVPDSVVKQIKECVAEKEKEGRVPYLTINLLG